MSPVPDARAVTVLALEDARRRELRRMKLGATALLVAAAVIYVVARSFHDDPPAWGYLEALGEAAVVAALADWFAVTALFRHPLGLPIPHTAIIPARKDQIGRSLGAFVESNFLAREPVADRLRHAHVSRRGVGEWPIAPGHASRAAEAVADALRSLLGALDDREAQATVERLVRHRLEATDVAALASRTIEVAVEGGHHQRLLDAGVTVVQRLLEEHRDTLRDLLGRESAWWVPEAIDRRITGRILDNVQRSLGELRHAPPDHPIRRSIERRVVELAERLRHDPVLAARVDDVKREVLNHPAVADWVASLWQDAKEGIVAATHDRGSELHVRTTVALVRIGERLRDEPELQARVDAGVERFVLYVVDHYRSEVAALIESTVARWDAPSTSRRLELQIGRDLQFIRINGTIVGGLAGVLIHAVSTQLL